MRAFWSNVSSWFSNHVAPYWAPAGLFNTTPPEQWVFKPGYITLIALCLVGGIVLLFAKKMRPGLRERLSSFCWNNLIIGLILYFFRDQRIPLLGMDLWRFIQEVAMITWIVIIFRYWKTKIPVENLAEKIAAHKAKYLPKAK